MICSVCEKEIQGQFCSNCGQYFKTIRISGASIFRDLFDNIFSLEKSFFKNIRFGLAQPSSIALNYWKGFRKFYYSPGRFFTIASLFLVGHYWIANDFLGVVVSSTLASQFVILFSNILFLTLWSTIVYIQYKRNIFEHLILNIYNVSLWTIVFVPISIVLNLLINDNRIEEFFFLPYHLLIVIWNSKAFELTILKRTMYVFLNLVLFYGTLAFLIYTFGSF